MYKCSPLWSCQAISVTVLWTWMAPPCFKLCAFQCATKLYQLHGNICCRIWYLSPFWTFISLEWTLENPSSEDSFSCCKFKQIRSNVWFRPPEAGTVEPWGTAAGHLFSHSVCGPKEGFVFLWAWWPATEFWESVIANREKILIP